MNISKGYPITYISCIAQCAALHTYYTHPDRTRRPRRLERDEVREVDPLAVPGWEGQGDLGLDLDLDPTRYGTRIRSARSAWLEGGESGSGGPRFHKNSTPLCFFFLLPTHSNCPGGEYVWGSVRGTPDATPEMHCPVVRYRDAVKLEQHVALSDDLAWGEVWGEAHVHT